MALYTRFEYRVGNLLKTKDVMVNTLDIQCPICRDYVDGYLEGDGDINELSCSCDINDYVISGEHDEIVEARDDTIAGYEDDIEDLKKEVEELKMELMDAKQ